jgi:hypothetical protein
MQSQRPSATPVAASNSTTIDSSTLYPATLAAAAAAALPAPVWTATRAAAIDTTAISTRREDSPPQRSVAFALHRRNSGDQGYGHENRL